jgi:hypothetical protein
VEDEAKREEWWLEEICWFPWHRSSHVIIFLSLSWEVLKHSPAFVLPPEGTSEEMLENQVERTKQWRDSHFRVWHWKE